MVKVVNTVRAASRNSWAALAFCVIMQRLESSQLPTVPKLAGQSRKCRHCPATVQISNTSLQCKTRTMRMRGMASPYRSMLSANLISFTMAPESLPPAKKPKRECHYDCSWTKEFKGITRSSRGKSKNRNLLMQFMHIVTTQYCWFICTLHLLLN